MLTRIALVLTLPLLLAACPDHEAQLAAQDDAKCREFGFAVGTTNYAQCRMALHQDRTAQQRQASAALTATGAQLLAIRNPPVQPLRPPVICNPFGQGFICQ